LFVVAVAVVPHWQLRTAVPALPSLLRFPFSLRLLLLLLLVVVLVLVVVLAVAGNWLPATGNCLSQSLHGLTLAALGSTLRAYLGITGVGAWKLRASRGAFSPRMRRAP